MYVCVKGKKGFAVLTTTCVPSSNEPGKSILELRIQAPQSSEPQFAPENKTETIIYVDDSIVPEQLPIITHALTDTVNRATWTSQFEIMTAAHVLPNHLDVRKASNFNILGTAESKGPCNLIIFTNEETQYPKHEIFRASEFLTKTQIVQPTDVIETIDVLNDHIKNLKQKTIVNLKVEIELPNETDTLEPLDYIPQLTKVGNTYFANLIDLASEEEKAYAFKISPSTARVNFAYEDLMLSRKITGGQHVGARY